MGEKLLDNLARALAEPMPRRRAVRVLGVALAGAAIPGLGSRVARAATAQAPPCNPNVETCCGPNERICWKDITSGSRDGYCCPAPAQFWSCGDKANGYKCINICPPDRQCGQICCPPKYKCSPRGCVQKGVCGPDITDALERALSRVKSEFASWSGTKRFAACANLVTLPGAAISWDVVELGPGGRERFARAHRPECSTCGFSVQVGRDCHYSGSVNYVVFGLMMRLCHDHFASSSVADWFSSEAMQELIYTYKNMTGTQAANFQAATEWALAGYQSRSVRPSPRGDRVEECQLCSKPYSGSGLTVRWTAIGNEYIR